MRVTWIGKLLLNYFFVHEFHELNEFMPCGRVLLCNPIKFGEDAGILPIVGHRNRKFVNNVVLLKARLFPFKGIHNVVASLKGQRSLSNSLGQRPRKIVISLFRVIGRVATNKPRGWVGNCNPRALPWAIAFRLSACFRTACYIVLCIMQVRNIMSKKHEYLEKDNNGNSVVTSIRFRKWKHHLT